MLDIGWWELMVVGMVALIVVGPKELPGMLRVIGRYVGMAKRHANEFRAQFDEVIRDSEFEDLRKDLNEIKSGTMESLDEAERSMRNELDGTKKYDWNAEAQAALNKTEGDAIAFENDAEQGGEQKADQALADESTANGAAEVDDDGEDDPGQVSDDGDVQPVSNDDPQPKAEAAR